MVLNNLESRWGLRAGSRGGGIRKQRDGNRETIPHVHPLYESLRTPVAKEYFCLLGLIRNSAVGFGQSALFKRAYSMFSVIIIKELLNDVSIMLNTQSTTQKRYQNDILNKLTYSDINYLSTHDVIKLRSIS